MGWREIREQWGPQAIWDAVLTRQMIGTMDWLVTYSLMPVLRLVSGDAATVERGFQEVLDKREPVRLLDSPRESWRKRYGSFVRELEWVSRALRSHLSQEEYEALVTGSVARAIEGWAGGLKPRFAALFQGEQDPEAVQASTRKIQKRIDRMISGNFFSKFNPVNFLVGPMELRELDMEKGYMEAYIPDCWMHRAVGDGKTQDEACVVSCKGGSEAAFGADSPLKVELEPKLPGFDCVMRASWDPAALRRGEVPERPEFFVPEERLLRKHRPADPLLQ